MANPVDGSHPHRPRGDPLLGRHPRAPEAAQPPPGQAAKPSVEARDVAPGKDALPDRYALPHNPLGTLVGVATQAAPVSALVRDLAVAASWNELTSRFSADFRAVQAQLVHFPGLNSVDKADRMFAFFAKYAERFTALAPPVSSPLHEEAVQQFLSALNGLGYGTLTEAMTRTSALHEAERLLRSTSAEELSYEASKLHFTSHDFPPSPPFDGGSQSPAAPSLELPSTGNRLSPDRKARGPGRWTDKVLGPNLVWNVLHLSRRGDVEDEREQDRRLERLGLVAMLTLAGIVALVVCLIALT